MLGGDPSRRKRVSNTYAAHIGCRKNISTKAHLPDRIEPANRRISVTDNEAVLIYFYPDHCADCYGVKIVRIEWSRYNRGHLIMRGLEFGGFAGVVCGIISVSYTHLDVYKRQI